MTNKPNNKVEEECIDNILEDNPGLARSDIETHIRQALTSHGEEERKQGYEQGVRDERERIEKWAKEQMAVIPRINPETFEQLGESNQHYIDKQRLLDYLQALKNN